MLKSLAERLEALTYKTADCWFFLGTVTSRGYGCIYIGPGRNQNDLVHRVVLELELGRKLFPGMQALHTCDVHNCVNPDHLFEGTNRQNVLDAQSKGAWTGAWHQTAAQLHQNALPGAMAVREKAHGR